MHMYSQSYNIVNAGIIHNILFELMHSLRCNYLANLKYFTAAMDITLEYIYSELKILI